MADLQMGAVESRFADIIWSNEPITSAELSKKSGELLGWKKTTAFTVLRRLCDKGIFKNDKGTVTSLITREEFYSAHSWTIPLRDRFRSFWRRSHPAKD